MTRARSRHGDRPGLRDWFLLMLLVLLWGSAFALTDVALQAFTPLQVVVGRLWIGASVLIVMILVSRQQMPRGVTAWTYIATMAVLGNVLPFFLISWGQQTIPSGLTGILMAVMPLVVLVLAHFLIPGERMNAPKVLGFILGFAGIVVLTGPAAIGSAGGNAAQLLAQLSVLAGAICYGLNLIVARRGPAMPPQLTAACVLLVSAALATMITLLYGEPAPSGVPVGPAIALASLGLFSTGLATVVYYGVVASAGPTFLSLINYLIPVYAVIAGAAFLGERLAMHSLVALAIILVAIVISHRPAILRTRP